MNIPKISAGINHKIFNNTKRVGQNIIETLPNQYKIITFPNGKQSVFDPNGNLVLTQIIKDRKKL